MAKRKNHHAVALGKRGASKGGKARAAKMTADQRKASAIHAVLCRWSRSYRAAWLEHKRNRRTLLAASSAKRRKPRKV